MGVMGAVNAEVNSLRLTQAMRCGSGADKRTGHGLVNAVRVREMGEAEAGRG